MKKIGKKIIIILCVLASVTSSKTSANESYKIESKNIVNVNGNNKKTLSPLKVYGTMATAFVGLAGLVALSTYIYFKTEDKNFKNTDAGKIYEEYKKECEEIDKVDGITKKEKEMAKQRLWAKYMLDFNNKS